MSSVFPLNKKTVEAWTNQSGKSFNLSDFVASMQTPVVALKFSSATCGPCHTIAPVYQSLSANVSTVITCFDVDVNEMESLAVAAQIRNLPTFQFYTMKLSTSGNLEKIAELVGADEMSLKNAFIKAVSLVKERTQKPQQQPQPQQQPLTSPQQSPQQFQGQQQQQQPQSFQSQMRAPVALPPPSSFQQQPQQFQQSLPSNVNIQPYAQPVQQTPSQMNNTAKSELIQIRQELVVLLTRLNNAINALP